LLRCAKVTGFVYIKGGFERDSTKEQDLNVQLSKLDAQGCEKIFQGKQSGASIRNEEKL